MGCCRALQIINVFCGLYSIGARANITVIEGVWTQGAFECNSTVTIRCHVNPNSYTVQWFVGNLVGSLADADCFGYGCTNSVKFRGRYTYTYNDSAGYSDLNIRHVSFDDDQMIYQCSDGSATNIFRLNATTIKAPPKTNTTMLNITTVSINNITAKLTTGCIYPAEEITLIWYSSLEDGSAFRNYHVNHKQVTCLPTMTCERANTSLESVLLINTTRSGHERIFYVNISYGSVLISKYVGKYNVSEAYSSTAVPTAVSTTKPTSTNSTTLKTSTFTTDLQYPSTVIHNDTTASTPTPGIKPKSKQSIGDFFEEHTFAAIAIGCCLFVIILAIFIFVCYKRKHRLNDNDTELSKMKT